MRVGFDARMIDHPGIGRYISNLLPAMLEEDRTVDLIIYGDPGKLLCFKHFNNCEVREYNAPLYSAKEFFSGTFSSDEFDLVHIPHFNVPFSGIKKLVVTIHDLIYLKFPGSAPFFKRIAARHAFSNAIKKADKVISVSGNTKNDIIKSFPQGKNKVKVIHEAADRHFHGIKDTKIIEEVKHKYDLSDRMILYVGSVKPHKNISTLLKAYGRLKNFGIPHQLVLAGKWDKKEDRLKKRIEESGVCYLGEIPTEDINVLYNLADVLVHVSLYEGFGLTVLEAMQCGTPVVVSDATSLPEVAGNAGLTVSPLNVGQIADTVYNVLINTGLREGMIKAGLEQSGKFSWKKTARETLDLYYSV